MHQRKTIRLAHYNYSQAGFYFVTLCCYQRKQLFGSINHQSWQPSPLALQVAHCWLNLPNRFSRLCLHSWVVMPNHFHAIVELQPTSEPEPVSLSRIIGSFKSISSRFVSPDKLWHRGYYEHVIRNEASYQNIVNYIQTNPQRWQDDYFHPELTSDRNPHKL